MKSKEELDEQVLQLNALMEELSDKEREKVLIVKKILEAVVKEHGPNGVFALAIVGAEMAQTAEREGWVEHG